MVLRSRRLNAIWKNLGHILELSGLPRKFMGARVQFSG